MIKNTHLCVVVVLIAYSCYVILAVDFLLGVTMFVASALLGANLHE